MKVGIIGAGFSAFSHIEALHRIPQVEVFGIASRNTGKAQKLAEKMGVPHVFDTMEDMIRDDRIEAIHNCTPNYVHYPINKMVLKMNKHLMSEKPLAVNAEESEELVRLAEVSKGLSAVCFNYRAYPLIKEIETLVSQNRYGRVFYVKGEFLQDWLLYDTDYNWRLDSEKGGQTRAVSDIGLHWCDTLQYVLGRRITAVFANLSSVHPVRYAPVRSKETFTDVKDTQTREVKVCSEDFGTVLVEFDDGIQGVFTVSQVTAGRKNHLQIEIAMEEASVEWNQEEPNRLWIGKRDSPNQVLVKDPHLMSAEAASLSHYPGGHQEGWPDALKNTLENFYSAVLNSPNPAASPEFATFNDGHQLMEVVEAVIESNEKKKWVDVNKRQHINQRRYRHV